MGYVGFSVAFSFAIAALLVAASMNLGAPVASLDDRRMAVPDDRHCARQLVGLLRIGLGRLVVLGSRRKRVVHALAGRDGAPAFARSHRKARHVQELDRVFAIVAFSLSLLGTFLVRSGVLTSVHAFATDPARGVFILAFLVLVIGGSLTLYAMRAGAVGGGAGFAMVSRESALLANNILLVVALGAVFLGTMYPMFLDALNLPKASVGPPYFNLVFPI